MFHSGTSTGTRRIGCRAGIGCLAVLIALLWFGLCAAQIDNPSFEESFSYGPPFRPFPSYWQPWGDSFSFNSTCTTLWSTDDDQSVMLYNRSGLPVFTDLWAGIWQFVDLTGVNYIAFDAMLLPDVGEDFGPFEASFLVNGHALWTQTVAGEYLDQLVDVSAYTDYCMVELRITALADGAPTTESGVFWDNLAFADAPAFVAASIALTPDTLVVCDPAWRKNAWDNWGRWVTCYIELEEGYDARDIDGETVSMALDDEDEIRAYMGRECWARSEANRANLTDIDRDGILERMVRFDRDAIEEIVAAGGTTVTIQGLLVDGETPFVGTAMIQVVEKGPRVPPRHVFQPVRRAFTRRFDHPAHGKKR